MEDKRSLFSEKRYVDPRWVSKCVSQSGHVVPKSKYLKYHKPVLLLFIILHLSDLIWLFEAIFYHWSSRYCCNKDKMLQMNNEDLVKSIWFNYTAKSVIYPHTTKLKWKICCTVWKAILTKMRPTGVEYGGILMAVHGLKCVWVINVLKCLLFGIWLNNMEP